MTNAKSKTGPVRRRNVCGPAQWEFVARTMRFIRPTAADTFGNLYWRKTCFEHSQAFAADSDRFVVDRFLLICGITREGDTNA